jgi:hypothetical protein
MSTRQATVAPRSGVEHGHGPQRERFLKLPRGYAVAASPASLLAAPRTAWVAGSAR